jgi:hypothetical protein
MGARMSTVGSQFHISNAALDALVALKPHLEGVRPSTAITHLMAHGALQAFVEDSTVAIKRSALEKSHPTKMSFAEVNAGIEVSLKKLQQAARHFFAKLEPTFEYVIPSALMSYLTQPGRGKMYNEAFQPSDLPASITFMGQFIDHDLTKNATNLVVREDNNDPPIPNVASPFIDLDSVYGARSDDDGTGGLISPREPDGRFILTKLDDSNNAYDVQRDSLGGAKIEDGRNDENQLILQVHLLLMRVHNLLIKVKGLSNAAAQKETIYNWQSVVLNDHLISVLDPTILQEVLADLKAEVANPGSVTRLKYRPAADGLKLPHEFAIAFRYGHSQLRNAYSVGPGRSFVLFKNVDPGPDFEDLRGNRPLTPERVIDWPYFISPDDDVRRSNKLDTFIASDVFDLPESAVPDTPTKFLGNLPLRNLIRSREIGLTSGEKLFDFYFGSGASGKLTPDQIEPDKSTQALFELQEAAGFQTPLWYYVLKEAELNGGLRLGKLGSRLVGEVVGGAIYYDPIAYVHDPGWQSAISGSNVVEMKDLVDFVQSKDAT